MKLQHLRLDTMLLIATITAAALSLCACATESIVAEPTGHTDGIESDENGLSSEAIESKSNQLVMKVPNASDFAVPLEQTSVTVYYTDEDEANAESAIKRLRMMGIERISVKKATGTDSPIVAYRSSDYIDAARLISEGLHIAPCLEIPNDGTDGWSYDSDIAIVVGKTS